VVIDGITFSAWGDVGNGQRHEFSVSGMNTNLVANPEPGTLALFGSGLAGLGVLRGRKRLSEKTI
jgi:hypothetical protein